MSTDFNILTTLWGKAKDHLDDAELKDVANLDEHAASPCARNAGLVLCGK